MGNRFYPFYFLGNSVSRWLFELSAAFPINGKEGMSRFWFRGAEGKVEKTLIFDIMTNVFWSANGRHTHDENAYTCVFVCLFVCLFVLRYMHCTHTTAHSNDTVKHTHCLAQVTDKKAD